MKKKSERYPYVTIEKWQTPVTKNSSINLRLDTVIQTEKHVYFFIYEIPKYNKETHVLSLPKGAPYQVMEEEYAAAGVDRYFYFKDSAPPKKRKKKTAPCATWKLRNTDLIQELNSGDALSSHGKLKSKDIIHYEIDTGNDIIEFISPVYEWKLHRNIPISRLVTQYARGKWDTHEKKI